MMRPLLSWLSPAGAKARLSVLIFHRVHAQTDPLFPGEVNAAQFDAICRWLRADFNVLPLDEAHQRLQAGALPARAAAITFDDGYADNHAVALPILQRHGLNACFFIASGFLDGGRMWNDSVVEALRRTPASSLDLPGLGRLPLSGIEQRRMAIEGVLRAIKHLPFAQRAERVAAITQAAGVPLPDDLMMRSEQVRELRRAGMVIGAHTVNHPILLALDDAAARREIGDGRDALQKLLGERVGLFAYPNGRPGQDFDQRHVCMVRELGFDAAWTTHAGVGQIGSDAFLLPRFTPWDRRRLPFLLRMGQNLRRTS